MAVRLGVNIDHVATLRRLRDTPYPDLLKAAQECVVGGADQITIHLREDRRHIVDADLVTLKASLKVDLNLEIAATEEMLQVALKTRPHSVCLVPEKRVERTTEGGLDLTNPKRNELYARIASETGQAGILPSFFIEPDPEHMDISKKLGAKAVELHTGALCLAYQKNDQASLDREWKRLKDAVAAGPKLNLTVHAGHGIDYQIARELSAIRGVAEYNIGHAIVCEAVFHGLREATRTMKEALTR